MTLHRPDSPTPASDWTRPGTYPLAPGIHRIPLPMPTDGLRAVNVYAIEADDGLVLVDAGWAVEAARRELERSLSDLGCGLGDIARFLVTHIHRDHYTQAVIVRREFGTRIALGAGELSAFEAMDDPQFSPSEPQLAQLREAGALPVIRWLAERGHDPYFDPAIWEHPDEWLEDRAVISVGGRELVTVATPGHTRGHVVFISEAEDLLFAGDHVLPHITPSIGFEAAPGTQPLGDYLHSLALIRSMPDMRLLPAHGPISDSTHRRIDELVDHHDQRLADCVTAVRSGAGTAYETARRLRWTSRGRAFDDLDRFNQMLATTETMAHLRLLAAQGVLSSERGDDGVIIYQAGQTSEGYHD